MKKWILFFGILLWPVSAFALPPLIVGPGEDVSGGTVPYGWEQNVEGTVRNFDVSGTQNILTGGKAYNSYIYSYAAQKVMQGGYAYGTQISQYGFQDVYGVAENTNVGNYASMNVKSGGLSKNATLRGANMFVLAGGTAEGTNLNISNMYVDGTSSGTVINRRGQEVVKQGGQSTGTTINTSGTQIVEEGGLAEDVSIRGGTQEIYGEAKNVNIYDGYLYVYSSADTVNGQGGRIDVFGNAEVKNLTVDGVQAVLDEGSRLTGNTLLTGRGDINLWGSSSIENLQMEDGTVNLVAGGYKTLQISELDGAGNFYINSSVSEGVNDKIIVQGGSGVYGIAIRDYSPDEVFAQDTVVVETQDPNQKFYLIGGAVDVGAFRYNLIQQGNNWVLDKSPIVSDSAIVAKNTFSSISSILYTHMQNLNGRIGDVRFDKKSGFWARGWGRELKLDFRDATSADIDVAGTQVGYDFDLPTSFFRRWLVGVYGGYSVSRQKFDREGNADGRTYGLGLYSTVVSRGGSYFDVIASYYHHNQKLKSHLPDGADVRGKYDTDGWSLSVEGGKRFTLADNWFLEPQLQVTYMDFGDIFYRTNFNTPVRGYDGGSILGRAGLMLGRKFEDTLKFPFELYVKADVLHEFSGNNRVKVADYEFKEDMLNTFYRLSVGGTAEINERSDIYFSLGTAFGDRVRLPVDAALGIRIEF